VTIAPVLEEPPVAPAETEDVDALPDPDEVEPVPVLLERDQNFPSFERLVEEIKTLDAIYQRATAQGAAR
jgi:hypothetical protein